MELRFVALFGRGFDSSRLQQTVMKDRFLRPERVSVFDREFVFRKLSRIGRNQTGKLLACSVDDVQIAVGAIIPPEPNVCAGSLRICGIHLHQRGKC